VRGNSEHSSFPAYQELLEFNSTSPPPFMSATVCSFCAIFAADHTENFRARLTSDGNYFSEFKVPYHRTDAWPSLPNLTKSAEAGCALCTVIRDGLHVKHREAEERAERSSPIVIAFTHGFRESNRSGPSGMITRSSCMDILPSLVFTPCPQPLSRQLLRLQSKQEADGAL
jgi:hypothetical protein